MKDLGHPAKSLYQNELNVQDKTIASEEDYHMVTGANRQLRRQILQNAQFLYDTTGSHASQDTSTSTKTQFDPNNQMAIAIKKLDTLNHCFFTQKQPPSLPRQFKKEWGAQWNNPLDQKRNFDRKSNKHMMMI